MHRIDAYLDELVARLDCDPLRRDEIRLEVHSHIRELVEEERRAGKSEADAVGRALERFGPVEEVAAGLAPVNRDRVASPVVVHRPVRLVFLGATAALVCYFLGLTGPYVVYRLLDASAMGPGEPLDQQTMRVLSAGMSVYPGFAVAFCLLLALALIARHYAAGKAWVWACAAYAVGTAIPMAVGIGLILAQADRAHLTLGSRSALWSYGYGWVRGVLGVSPILVLATLFTPTLARLLGGRRVRVPWPALAIGLALTAFWANPVVLVDGGSGRLLGVTPAEAMALLSLPLQITRLLAMLAAMWLAGQLALQTPLGLRAGRAALYAAGIGLLAGSLAALVAMSGLAPELFGGSSWETMALWRRAEHLVILTAGAAVMALVRLTASQQTALGAVSAGEVSPA
jgi:hypothetical protein